jgi:hypothetical protein
MRYFFFSYLFVFLLSLPMALAEVGTDCMATSDCQPGEFCIARLEGMGMFCTRRCGNNPCPEGFSCQEKNGIQLCDYGAADSFGGMGESCANGCEGDLFCVNDPTGDASQAYCSRSCIGAGTCPSGFYCNLVQSANEPRICAKQNQLPAYGEPCQNMQCAEGYSCITSPERALPYCSASCENSPCINDMECGADRLCHHPSASKPGIGEDCVNDMSSQEQALVGCANNLECFTRGKFTFCTQSCNSFMPCPEGMGCVYRNGQVELGIDGLCTPYEESSLGLEDKSGNSGTGGSSTSGGSTTSGGSSTSGGSTTTTEETTKTSGGCQQKGNDFEFMILLVMMLFGRFWQLMKS